MRWMVSVLASVSVQIISLASPDRQKLAVELEKVVNELAAMYLKFKMPPASIALYISPRVRVTAVAEPLAYILQSVAVPSGRMQSVDVAPDCAIGMSRVVVGVVSMDSDVCVTVRLQTTHANILTALAMVIQRVFANVTD